MKKQGIIIFIFITFSLFNHIKPYNLWELRSYVQMAFGEVPMAWGCPQIWPPFMGKIAGHITKSWNLNHCPFGSVLGLAATMVYRVKTDNVNRFSEDMPRKVIVVAGGLG